MTLTGDKSLKMDFLFFFLRSHLNLALFAPNSIQNWEIKKIRWVCHNLPGPFNYLGCQKGHLLHFEKFAVVVVGSRDYNIRQNFLTLDWIYIAIKNNFEKFAVVVVGSRDYNIRRKFLTTVLIWSNLIFWNLRIWKFAVVVVGSRDYNIRQNLLTLDWIYIAIKNLKSLRWWWWAVGTIDSTLVLRLGLDWTGLGRGLDNLLSRNILDKLHYKSCRIPQNWEL